MKKRILAVLLLLSTLLFAFTGCGNHDVIDTVYTYNKAYIYVGGTWTEIDVKNWRDYQDGDQLQVTATDGTVYLSSANNIVLVKEVK